ncbi:MAG: hypothetical protein M0Z94_08050 [Dehalococcoidales bacterium]|nr:hypothetical protein [Dehalococcoidales bacterium]
MESTATTETQEETIEERLRRLKDTLSDLDYERRATLGQTGVHIGAKEVAKLRASWRRDEERLLAEIEALTAQLAASEGGNDGG